jgi:gamma-glutamyl hydrolase
MTENTMPVTNQKQPIFTKPTKWWPYVTVFLLSVVVISVVSNIVIHNQQSEHPRKLIQRGPSIVIKMDKPTEERDQLPVKTQVPVIGILTQVLRDYKRFTKEHHLHIAASYVKWIESAGAQVVPILLNQNDNYYEQIFKQTNGLLLPGGDNLLDPHKNTPMMVAAKKLYKLAVEANDRGDFYPIWGTCLGLELLSVLSSNMNVLDSCSATDLALPMNFVERGRMFAPASYSNIPQLNEDYSGVIVNILAKGNLTYNYHMKCLTESGLKQSGLSNFYRPLAYSADSNDNKFITIFEAFKYPFYGVQFHPEKPPFEFVTKSKQHHIPHSREAIAVSRYFADFFVQQAQYNGHLIDRELMDKNLIYAYNPMYTALLHDMYEQRYLFPFGSDFGAGSTEEFLDHIPDDNETVPEDVTRWR